jgi:hypothetical protein
MDARALTRYYSGPETSATGCRASNLSLLRIFISQYCESQHAEPAAIAEVAHRQLCVRGEEH